MQEQIPSAFRRGGCEKYENDRGSSLLSAKMRKTSENVSLNQRGNRIDAGKEVHGIRQWEIQ